jgi:transposase
MGRRLRSRAPDSGHYGVVSDRGGRRAAAMYSVIVTAKMNSVDPLAWLADVLARVATHPAHRLDELLPWNWRPPASAASARAA